jgi:hypothetical protein
MKTKQIIISIIFLFPISISCFSQSIGACIVGNPQTESIGIGLRFEKPYSYVSIVPQFSYYPFFNKVSEYYLGASLHINIIENSSARIYGIINGSYNSWMNYSESPMKNAKETNWGAEFGAGIVGQSCITPFAEYRYNLKWHETNFRIGILLDLDCGSGAAGYHAGSRNAVSCPGH